MPDFRPLFPPSIREIVFNPPEAWTKHLDEAEVGVHLRARIEQSQRELLYRVAELVEDQRFASLQVVCLCNCKLSIDGQLAECFEALNRIKATGVSVLGHMGTLKGSERAWRRHLRVHDTVRSQEDVMETEPRPAWETSRSCLRRGRGIATESRRVEEDS